MVGPQGWAARRHIAVRIQRNDVRPIGLSLVRQWMATYRPGPLKLPLDVAMLSGLKQRAITYRVPLVGYLGSMAAIAGVALAMHSWHAHRMSATVASAAVAQARVEHPVASSKSVRMPDSSIYQLPTRRTAKVGLSNQSRDTALGLAGDGTIVVVAQAPSNHAGGFNLDVTSPASLWARAGARYHIDPVLIYAIALVESRGVQPDGSVAPSPWIVRINGHLHNGTRAQSEHAIELANLLAVPVQDVGIMQVYYPMHRDMEPDPIALLNPARNIDIGTRLLRKAMKESGDPVLRIGYYHSHDVALARGYGQMVLNVYRELKTAMGKSPTSVIALERTKADMVAMHSGG